MAGADEEMSTAHSEDQKEENGTETVSEQPAAAEEADQGEDQQPQMKSGRKRGCPIDWSDQSTFSPSKPKNVMTIEELENAKKAKRKEQQEISKAAKAARRKQKLLSDKASHLTNEDLIEIVQQRRHRQEEKAKKGKAKASAAKEKSKLSGASTG